MIDNSNIVGGKSVSGDRVSAHPISDDVKTGNHKPSPSDSQIAPPHINRDTVPAIHQRELTCPQCGKSTLHAEFPDQYEVWIKCPSCGFFMGMTKDEWHHMENSPNINEKIKKMVIIKDGHIEKHEHQVSSKTCKVCSSPYCHECNPSILGICEKCGYKILIVLVIVMITISYVAWFGVF